MAHLNGGPGQDLHHSRGRDPLRGIHREAPHDGMRRSRWSARVGFDAGRARAPTSSLRCRLEKRRPVVEHAGEPSTTPRRGHPRARCRSSPGPRSRGLISARSPRSQNAPHASSQRMPRSSQSPRPRSRTCGSANAGCRDRRTPQRQPERPRLAKPATQARRRPGGPVGPNPPSPLPRRPVRSASPSAEG